MRNRRQIMWGAVVLMSMGLISLFNVVNKPHFDTFRPVDVQLIATGICFGAAIGLLAMFFAGRA